MPKEALYLLIVRQQFAELCELLCSVAIPHTMPNILNYLLRRPVEKLQNTCFWNDIIDGFLRTPPQKTNVASTISSLFFLDHTVLWLIPFLSVSIGERRLVDATQSGKSTGQIKSRHAGKRLKGLGMWLETELTD